jgi:hypothetical protein
VGNKGTIGAEAPFINTEQGNSSGDKGCVLIVRSSIILLLPLLMNGPLAPI